MKIEGDPFMKKTILVLATVLTVAGAIAQDTIRTCLPLDNYLYNYWNEYKEGDMVYCNQSENYPYQAPSGLVMYNYDSLPIYGVAVGVDLIAASSHFEYDSVQGWRTVPGDTALDESYMHFLFMEVDGDSVYKASDSLLLHMKYSPVSYYLDNGLLTLAYPQGVPCKIIPVYELYFDSAVSVYDKFYLIGRNHSEEPDENGNNLFPHIRVAGWNVQSSVPRLSVINWPPFPSYFFPDSLIDYGWEESTDYLWQWLFPILTPNPDTTHYVPDDSTSVQVAVWERYVSVQPNPATDKVTVLSSVGLTQVEVFDITGNRMLMHEASGLSVKLDVGTLPRGTYIVRIQTPMGTTARKLLLR